VRCPRCGEDNLPGLQACLGCGQDLSSDPSELEIATRPRVRAANPLAGPQRPERPRRPLIRVSDAGVILTRRVFAALLWGLLVGLGPWRRGDQRTAALLLVALAGCVGLWFALWYSAIQPVAWMGVLSVLATSAVIEARAREPRLTMEHSIVVTLFALSMALWVHVAAAFAYDSFWPRVVIPDTMAMEGGAFLVDPVIDGELEVNDLVAVGALPRFWQLAPEPVEAGPVLALPGQRVEVDDGVLLVDGAPTQVQILNPRAVPRLVGADGMLVPEGMVAVLIDPITLMRPEDLLGRISYRWTPAAERGPLQWPPPQALEPP